MIIPMRAVGSLSPLRRDTLTTSTRDNRGCEPSEFAVRGRVMWLPTAT